MLVHDHRPSNSQPLPRAPSDLLGGEEGIVDLVANLPRNAATRVGDADHHRCAFVLRSDGNGASLPRVLDHVRDGVSGVDDDVQDGLIELTGAAGNRRQISQFHLDVGDVFVLAASNGERVFDCTVQIDGRHFTLIGMGKLLHRSHNRGHARESVEGTLDCRRKILHNVGKVRVLLGLGDFGGGLRPRPAIVENAVPLLVPLDERGQVLHGVADEDDVVVYELDGRVNFVSDAGRQPSDRCQLLLLNQPRACRYQLRDARLQLSCLGRQPLVGVRQRVVCMAQSHLGARPGGEIDSHNRRERKGSQKNQPGFSAQAPGGGFGRRAADRPRPTRDVDWSDIPEITHFG